ncbi:hypothetical protein LTS12_027498 [Elasticomyces elasticus]|nr:hypothetical protein LTS12_027498 [Elasticomyces elasticus]
MCWEKFSPLSSEAQRNLVTDDKVSVGPKTDHGDVSIDPAWEKVRPKEGMVESATPELMTYFTYLHGLYPLNFTRYIHKPHRFLKDGEFPGAKDFDLEQAVIRSRTEQFRQVHRMHSNFYNMTVEKELIDLKWPKADPADVVAECHALCINTKPSLLNPDPPPTTKLPQLPQLPSIANMRNSPQISPTGVTLNRRRQYPRKYANSVEANLTRKLKDLKKEQESWNAQADELQRLLVELIKYRDILVRTEQRELEKSMALEIYKRKDENRQDTDKDLRRAQLKLREYEAREFEMEKAKREVEARR